MPNGLPRNINTVPLLENGADIVHYPNAWGHREIRTAEIYRKIIDEKMKEAANLIPKLNLDIV